MKNEKFKQLTADTYKARIYHPCSSGFYWGQVYDKQNEYWKTVTLSCYTEWGAKRELKKWSQTHHPKVFEI